LAQERNALGSQTARKGEGSRQRSGEARWGWARTQDSPQLPAGDLRYPNASLSVSATFVFRSAGCPILASMLLSHEASQTHGGSHVQPTEAARSRSHVPAVHRVGDGSERSLLAAGLAASCWRRLPAEHPLIPSSPAPARRHARAAPFPVGAPYQWLPRPIPAHILLNTLAQPHSYLMGPTRAALAHSWSPS